MTEQNQGQGPRPDQEHAGVRATTWKQPGGKTPVDALQADDVRVETVEGETVIVKDSTAGSVTGERVSMERSAVNTMDARSAQLDKSAVKSLTAERAVLQDSAAMIVSTDSTRMVKSSALLVSANEAHFEDSRAIIIVGGSVSGEARSVLNVSATTMIGLVLGLVALLVLALLARGRKG